MEKQLLRLKLDRKGHHEMEPRLFFVFMQELFGQMTDVCRASSQPILMYFVTSQVLSERAHLDHDLC